MPITLLTALTGLISGDKLVGLGRELLASEEVVGEDGARAVGDGAGPGQVGVAGCQPLLVYRFKGAAVKRKSEGV